jgi:uncharacterized protein with HEPN domain
LTRDLKLYLEDILNAVKEVEEFMKGLSFEDFCEDAKVTRAVTMDFICTKKTMIPSPNLFIII